MSRCSPHLFGSFFPSQRWCHGTGLDSGGEGGGVWFGGGGRVRGAPFIMLVRLEYREKMLPFFEHLDCTRKIFAHFWKASGKFQQIHRAPGKYPCITVELFKFQYINRFFCYNKIFNNQRSYSKNSIHSTIPL